MNESAARFPRWNRPTNRLTYLPMQDLLEYLRANGFKTYIVTGGGVDVTLQSPGATADFSISAGQ